MQNSEYGAMTKTRDFWDKNPCDTDFEINERARIRYDKEPWLLPILLEIAKYDSVLEVGCGQGTDGLFVCQNIGPGRSYTGIDLSGESIKRATDSVSSLKSFLKAQPEFKVENAENLNFESNMFDCVYSVGALHHTDNTGKAVQEILRVLRPGGVAYVMLYRRASLKVMAAHLLRAFSRFVDCVTFGDRRIWTALSKYGTRHRFGTMFLECFGVPILRSYTKQGLDRLFSGFKNIEIYKSGMGLPIAGVNKKMDAFLNGIFGTMWIVKCKK